jgi:excisionase family DNA binding protein
MEGLVTVRASDLTEIMKKLTILESELKLSRQLDEEVKAYSIDQAAELLNVSYNTVRKLIHTKKVFAKYLCGTYGKCIIPYRALKEYLQSKEDSNKIN